MSWEGLDVAILSPTPIAPLDHGNRKRIDSICKRLRHFGARVHFLHYPAEHDWRRSVPDGVENAMRDKLDSYYLIPTSRDLHPYAIADDHEIDEWWDSAIETYLRWFFEHVHVQVFIVEYTWLSKAFEYAPSNCIKILDTHDKFADRRKLLASLDLAPEFFYTTVEEEAKAVNRADIVWAIKEQEAQYFRSLTSAKVRTLLHWEEADPIPQKPHAGFLRAGIIGARNSINKSNITRFLDVALPMIRHYMAPVKIVIAGGCCDDFQHIKHPNVELLGRVDSVRAFYESLDVAVVPMDRSTGLKIKVAEAISLQVPVVAHEHAFEGFPARHQDHTQKSFEDMTLSLVRHAFDPSELQHLREATVASSDALAESFDETITRTGDDVRKLGHVIALVTTEKQMRSPFFRLLLIDNAQYLSYLGFVQVYVLHSGSGMTMDTISHPNSNLKLKPKFVRTDYPDTDTTLPVSNFEHDQVREIFDYRPAAKFPTVSIDSTRQQYWRRFIDISSAKVEPKNAASFGSKNVIIMNATPTAAKALPVDAVQDCIPYFYNQQLIETLNIEMDSDKRILLFDGRVSKIIYALQLALEQKSDPQQLLFVDTSQAIETQFELIDQFIAQRSAPRFVFNTSESSIADSIIGEFFLRIGCTIHTIRSLTNQSHSFCFSAPIVEMVSRISDKHIERQAMKNRENYSSFQRSIYNDAGWTRVWRAVSDRKTGTIEDRSIFGFWTH